MRASDIIRLAAIMCCMSIALDARASALPVQSTQTVRFSSAVFLPLALFAQNDDDDDDDDDDNDGNTGGGGADDGGADDGGAGNGGSGNDDGGVGGGGDDGGTNGNGADDGGVSGADGNTGDDNGADDGGADGNTPDDNGTDDNATGDNGANTGTDDDASDNDSNGGASDDDDGNGAASDDDSSAPASVGPGGPSADNDGQDDQPGDDGANVPPSTGPTTGGDDGPAAGQGPAPSHGPGGTGRGGDDDDDDDGPSAGPPPSSTAPVATPPAPARPGAGSSSGSAPIRRAASPSRPRSAAPARAVQRAPARPASRPVRAQGSGPSPSQGPSASPAVSSPFIPEFQDENGYRAKTGEIIALFPTEQSNRVFQEQGFEVLRRLTFPALAIEATILKVPSKLNTRNALKLLREKDPQTRYDYNHLYDFRPSRDVGIPYRPGMDIFERKTLSTRTDVAVGIIDTGVNVTHPDLSAARVEQKRFEKLADGVSLSHGTGVASILADQRDGLVPNAQLYAASVFGPAKAGDPVGAVVEISQAIDWMVGKSVAVLNMSLAGPPNALLELAVTKATAKGHAIVAAVGNMGPAAKPLYPASYPGVVGVTAVDKTDKIYRRAAQGTQVDFSGPGVSIKSASGTGSGETVHTGTSFAVPFVAAVIALEVTRPNPAALKSAIARSEKSAQDLGTPGRDDVFGHGRVKLVP